MKRTEAVIIALLVVAVPAGAVPLVWINEIHYDNVGTDAGEFVEVAGVAGTDLSSLQLVLYNGGNGAAYNTLGLSGFIPSQQNGFGTMSFSYPVNGIQNGSPDGVALYDTASATLIQFLSYEGTFAGVGGVANGVTSTDIGVLENGNEAAGASLQLVGTGNSYLDFSWVGPLSESPGSVNAGQVFPIPDATSTFALLGVTCVGLSLFRRRASCY